jgi:hypothetical protein
MKDEITPQKSSRERFGEELKRIYEEFPDAENGLVEFQLWMKLLHEKQVAEKTKM